MNDCFIKLKKEDDIVGILERQILVTLPTLVLLIYTTYVVYRLSKKYSKIKYKTVFENNIIKIMIFYPIFIFINYFPIMIQRALDIFGEELAIYSYISALTNVLSGIVNTVVYGYYSYLKTILEINQPYL